MLSKKLLSNEDQMAEFREFGVKRGIPIGLFAGLSMGLAGRFYCCRYEIHWGKPFLELLERLHLKL